MEIKVYVSRIELTGRGAPQMPGMPQPQNNETYMITLAPSASEDGIVRNGMNFTLPVSDAGDFQVGKEYSMRFEPVAQEEKDEELPL